MSIMLVAFSWGFGGRRTSDADEFSRALGDQLLLEEAGAAALYAVELGVDLVCAVEGDVEHGVVGEGVEGHGGQAGFDDDLARLVAGGDEADGGVGGDLFYGFDDVDDGGAGADADVGGRGVEVVLDGLLGGGAFGGLDGCVGHGGRAGEASRVWALDWSFWRLKRGAWWAMRRKRPREVDGALINGVRKGLVVV